MSSSKNFQFHPAGKFIGDTEIDHETFQRFSALLYRGLHYSVRNLKGPSE